MNVKKTKKFKENRPENSMSMTEVVFLRIRKWVQTENRSFQFFVCPLPDKLKEWVRPGEPWLSSIGGHRFFIHRASCLLVSFIFNKGWFLWKQS